MDGSRRMVLLLGLSLLTSLTGCHGRFLIPPPPGYAYGANPATGGAYGQYGDCVTGGYGAGDYGYGAHGQRLHDLRENLQARRDDRLARRQGRHPGHRRGRKRGQGAHGDIGCDTYYDVGCDGSGMCDIGGACDSYDCCGECEIDCDVECCGSCSSCSSCGCGGMMMGGTNPGPYVAYLIPMESYQGELGGGMCCDGMSGCDSCGPGIIEGEFMGAGVFDGGMTSGCPCEYADGGTCAGGGCQTYLGEDQHWQTVPGTIQSPDAYPSGSEPQPIHSRPQESLPVPPSSGSPSDPEEGDFQQPSPSGGETQAGYLPPQNGQWVPNQF